MALASSARIKSKEDFQIVYKEGQKWRGKFFTAFFLKSDKIRLGAVVSSKVSGSAVERNRIRRTIQNFVQKNILDSTRTLKGDIVIVVHSVPETLKGIENDLNEWQKKFLSV